MLRFDLLKKNYFLIINDTFCGWNWNWNLNAKQQQNYGWCESERVCDISSYCCCSDVATGKLKEFCFFFRVSFSCRHIFNRKLDFCLIYNAYMHIHMHTNVKCFECRCVCACVRLCAWKAEKSKSFQDRHISFHSMDNNSVPFYAKDHHHSHLT